MHSYGSEKTPQAPTVGLPEFDGDVPPIVSAIENAGSKDALLPTTAQDNGARVSGNGWPESPRDLPPPYPPVPGMDDSLIPKPLRPWIADSAERMCVGAEFIAIPALVALSAVVGRKIGVRPKRHDDWTVVPNLWGVIVAPPGTLKSQAIREGTGPLSALAKAAHAAFEHAQENSEASLATLELEIGVLESKLKASLKSGNDGAILQSQIADRKAQLVSQTPIERRYLTNDATVEKLGELLVTNPKGMVVLRDELLGWLLTMEKHGREGDRQFYLEAWNGDGAFNVDRIGRGSLHIPALTLSVLGGIQPSALRRYVDEALGKVGSADGLLQRFQLLVWPDLKPGWVNVDRTPDMKARSVAFDAFSKIDGVDPGWLDPEIGGSIPALRFSDVAQEIFDEWRNKLEIRLRGEELVNRPALIAHLAKYRSLMPSLALLFHLVDRITGSTDNAPILPDAVLRSIAWCDYLELSAQKTYGCERTTSSAEELYRRIHSDDVRDGDAIRAIYRHHWSGLIRPGEVEAAIAVLEPLGVARREGGKAGLPSILRVHPKLRTHAAK